MKPMLSTPIREYLAGSNAGDARAVAAAFAVDGTVHDEGGTYVGHDAILAWAESTIRRYHMQSEPLSAVESGGTTMVIIRLTGGFPGSPLQLRYEFKLGEGGIQFLEVIP
jgi:hypothetical protein